MFAVILTGGKQYKVREGQRLKVEKLPQEVGQSVDFEEVLMLGDGADVQIGRPRVDGAKVTAKVLNQSRAKKIKIIKFKRRKHHMKRQGHRQYYTEVQVTGISK